MYSASIRLSLEGIFSPGMKVAVTPVVSLFNGSRIRPIKPLELLVQSGSREDNVVVVLGSFKSSVVDFVP